MKIKLLQNLISVLRSEDEVEAKIEKDHIRNDDYLVVRIPLIRNEAKFLKEICEIPSES